MAYEPIYELAGSIFDARKMMNRASVMGTMSHRLASSRPTRLHCLPTSIGQCSAMELRLFAERDG
jgi:hypothetical protein